MKLSPQIRVDDEVYDRLKRQAEPFVDTPNSVLRRLLGLERSVNQIVGTASIQRPRRVSPRSVQKVDALPQEAYEVPILKSLVDRGGTASASDVLRDVQKSMGKSMRPADHDRQRTGDIRWRNRAQWARLKLVERGLLASEAPRGVWVVTEAGKQVIEQAKR